MREGGGVRLASVVLYFQPGFLNFGNSLAASVNFVARVEIIMIKYSPLLQGQSNKIKLINRCNDKGMIVLIKIPRFVKFPRFD